MQLPSSNDTSFRTMKWKLTSGATSLIMLKNKRTVLYALIWVALSAGLYFLLPKLKQTPRPNNTTVVVTDNAEGSKLVAQVRPEPPKEDPRPQTPVVETPKPPVVPPMPEPTPVPPDLVEPTKAPEPRPV